MKYEVTYIREKCVGSLLTVTAVFS
jgi:hypothetical protein